MKKTSLYLSRLAVFTSVGVAAKQHLHRCIDEDESEIQDKVLPQWLTQSMQLSLPEGRGPRVPVITLSHG